MDNDNSNKPEMDFELEQLNKQESANIVAEQMAKMLAKNMDMDVEQTERFIDAYKNIVAPCFKGPTALGLPIFPSQANYTPYTPPPSIFSTYNVDDYSVTIYKIHELLNFETMRIKLSSREIEFVFSDMIISFQQPDSVRLLDILHTHYQFPSLEELEKQLA